MKKALPYCLAAVFAACFCASAVKLHSLRSELDGARAELDDAQAEIDVLRAAVAKGKTDARPQTPPRRVREEKPRKETQPKSGIDDQSFEKAVEKRVKEKLEEERRAREEEREAKRKEWENMTDEQFEAKRQEFQERMQEHTSKFLEAFVEKAQLNEEQCVALENSLAMLDSRIRDISGDFAAYLDEGGEFNFETQMRLFSEATTAIVDTYDSLDPALPENWRDNDAGFNVLMGIGMDAMNPLMDSLRRKGMRGFPFMGGPGGPPP